MLLILMLIHNEIWNNWKLITKLNDSLTPIAQLLENNPHKEFYAFHSIIPAYQRYFVSLKLIMVLIIIMKLIKY